MCGGRARYGFALTHPRHLQPVRRWIVRFNAEGYNAFSVADPLHIGGGIRCYLTLCECFRPSECVLPTRGVR